LGDTSFRAIVLAICCAEPLKVPGGGAVESVLTLFTHLRFGRRFATRHPSSVSFEELDGARSCFSAAARLVNVPKLLLTR